jgi:hypothetical protein
MLRDVIRLITWVLGHTTMKACEQVLASEKVLLIPHLCAGSNKCVGSPRPDTVLVAQTLYIRRECSLLPLLGLTKA